MAKRRKSKSRKSCPAGSRKVHFKGQGAKTVCFKKGKKKRGGKKSGIAKMSTAARKAMTRKACARPGVAKKMPGLCKWARK